jgi:hypothetical protein
MRAESLPNTGSSRFINPPHRTDLPRLITLLAIGMLLGNLSGCIILPIPVARTSGAIPTYRSNIGDQAPATLVQGSTTRRQVLLELGEPDGRGADDRWFTYESVSRRGGLHWAYVVGAETGRGAIGSIDDWDTARRLTIRFDDRGVIAGVSLDQKNCTNSFLDSADCPSASGEDLAKVDEEQRGVQLIAASGDVLGRYRSFELLRAGGSDCSLGHREPYASGDQFVVTQQRLVWRNRQQRWDSLALDDIQGVRAIEDHMFQHWIPLEVRDGSRLCLRITESDGRHMPGWSTNDAHNHIAAAVTAARDGNH